MQRRLRKSDFARTSRRVGSAVLRISISPFAYSSSYMMSKPLLTLSISLFWIAAAFAQAPQPKTILLWPNGAPGAQGTADEDRPSLTIYLATGNKVPTGVVVCPGGGYTHLALDHEGTQIAAWLNQRGISAFVLKYRLGPRYHHPDRTRRRPACRALRSSACLGIRHRS